MQRIRLPISSSAPRTRVFITEVQALNAAAAAGYRLDVLGMSPAAPAPARLAAYASGNGGRAWAVRCSAGGWVILKPCKRNS